MGNWLDNEITGNAGDNDLDGGDGVDILDGAGGSDTAIYFWSPSEVAANLATGTTSDDGWNGSDTLLNIENLQGSQFDDVLTGNSGANSLAGEGGDDLLEGGAGDDALDGGAGTDTASFASAGSAVLADLSEGTAETAASGSVLALNGTATSHVIAGGVSGLSAGAVSVELWMKSDDATNLGTPFSYGVTGNNEEILIYNYQNLVVFIGGHPVFTGISVNDGDWHHIAVTWQASDGRLVFYLDGAQAYTDIVNPGHTLGTSGTVVLGQEQDAPGGGFASNQAFDGEMTDVRIWSDVRTAGEIAANFDVRLTGSEAGLVANWGLDEGSGATAQDQAAGGHDGTITNGSWAAGSDPLSGGGSDTLVSIENLIGSDYDDTLIGDDGDNILDGGAGSDTFVFIAGSGDDTISGFTAGLSAADVLDYSSQGLVFGQLDIAQSGPDTVITNLVTGDTVTLLGVTATDLNQGTDFVL